METSMSMSTSMDLSMSPVTEHHGDGVIVYYGVFNPRLDLT